MHFIRRIIQSLLCLLVFTANSALALAYPYANSFDTVAERAEWTLTAGGDWGLSTSDHNNWTADSPTGFLDNNPSEINQRNRNTNQEATLTDFVAIPVNATQPMLTYRYKSDLSIGGQVYVEIQTQGSNGWVAIFTHTTLHDRENYMTAELDLSTYKGQSIRLRFRPNYIWPVGARMFVVDDLMIADFSLPTLAYPYTNNFDSANEQNEWSLLGDWGLSTTDHNEWTADSPTGFLDNNRNEVNQRNHATAQSATLTGYVSIPANATQPTLTYRYKSDLSIGGQIFLEIQTPGSSNWVTFFTHTTLYDRGSYTTADLDLSAYKGQSIRLRFRQDYIWQVGARMFVVDDLKITDFSLQSFTYPYSNYFDSGDEQDDWTLLGDWGLSTTDHNNWTANSPTGFLDNNRNEVDQSNHKVAQSVTLNGYVTIPANAPQPMLTYRYKSDLESIDEIYVEIQTQGSTSWDILFTHTILYDRETYTVSELDLSAYKGQSIRLRFRQSISWQHVARMFVVDDLKIEDFSLEAFAYPYTNNFDNDEQQDDWSLLGDWGLSTSDHNNWIADSPYGFLDNNRNEVEQRLHQIAQTATLNGYVSIPANATQPTLTYRYRSELINLDGVYVEVQTQGSTNWVILSTSTIAQNQAIYTILQNDLSAYAGQNIRIRFRQHYSWIAGVRMFTVDDFCINDLADKCVFEVQPVAEWRFDDLFWNGDGGDVKDSSQRGLHGTSMFETFTDAADPAIPGTSGTCRYGVFDGHAGNKTKQHIQLPSDPRLNEISDALTLTSWVKISSSSWYNYIISNDKDNASKGFSLRFSADNRLFFTVWDDSGVIHPLIGFSHLNLDQWYHVAATFDGSVMKIYIDGQLERSTNFSGTIGTPSSFDTALAGMGYKPETYNFTGSLDEVRVYDVALDETRIQEIMGETRSCDGACSIQGDYLLFEDDFDDGDYASWTVHRFNGKGCNWTVENGQLKEQRNSCHGFLGHNLNSGEENLTDYVIKTHVDARPTGGNNGVGLVFGYVDDSNYYLVRWHDYGSIYSNNATYRDFELIKVRAGVTTTLDKKTQLDLPDSFDITVDVTDGRGIDVYINCDLQTLGLHADNEYPAIKEFGLYTRDNDSAVFYDDVEVYGKLSLLPDPLAAWHLDENRWNGSADEVKDGSGNNLHGTSMFGAITDNSEPAIPGAVGTCGYGVFDTATDGIKRHIALGNDPKINQISDAVTLASWVNIESSSSYNYLFSNARDCCGAYKGIELRIVGNNNTPRFTIWDDTGAAQHLSSSVNVSLNTWNHIVATFDGSTISIYVNGALAGSRVFGGKIGTPASYDSALGGMGLNPGTYNLNGFLDEVYLYDQALTASQVRTLMLKQHGCAIIGLDSFKVSHDGAGIHCLSEIVLVTAKDANNDDYSPYTGTITLDTQTGTGSWTATTGSGVLIDATANDGLATYTFDPADNGATTFTLSYEDGQAVFNIDVYDGAIRDDDSEEDFTFAANGFLLTANLISNPPPAIINDPITTKTSGQDFSVYMTAYGQSATHPECGVIENYTGNKTIRFAGDYRNPTSGTLDISVNGSAIRMGNLDPGRMISFVNGKAQITANYSDAGKVRIRAYDTTEADNVYGATNDFVVKPAGFDFSIKRSSDSFVNLAATDENGSIFVAAGENFDVEVTPVNINGDTTPNYGNESTPESIKILHSLVAPIDGAPGTLSGTLSLQGSGVFSGTFNWSEVGIIDLAATVFDDDYLATGNINSDSGNVGRFTPDHFELSNKMFGALDVSCPSGSGFNYIGQPFGYAAGNQPEFQIEAKNLAGTTTLNYNGSYAKLGTGGISIPQVSQDSSNAMAISHQQAAASFSTVSNGVFKYTFGSDQFTYDRSNSPIGSFNSNIDIVIDSITDSDGVSDNFSTAELLEPTTVNMRYGRLMIDSAFGSELVDLVLPIKVQLYNSGIGDFVTHTDDTCSSFSMLPLEMLDTLNPALVTTSLSSLAAGEATLTISAPGAGKTGSFGVILDAPTWLEFDWGRPVGEANRLEPKATASFGIYSGNDAFIYRREIR